MSQDSDSDNGGQPTEPEQAMNPYVVILLNTNLNGRNGLLDFQGPQELIHQLEM